MFVVRLSAPFLPRKERLTGGCNPSVSDSKCQVFFGLASVLICLPPADEGRMLVEREEIRIQGLGTGSS